MGAGEDPPAPKQIPGFPLFYFKIQVLLHKQPTGNIGNFQLIYYSTCET